MTAIIIKSFPGIKRKNDKAVFCFRKKKIDLYLPGHKLGIEIDEKGHMDRKKRKEEEKMK